MHKLSHQRDIKIDYRKIPGADHFVFATRPRLLNVLLAQFLSTAPQAN